MRKAVRFVQQFAAATAYVLLALAGVLAFCIPSPTLLMQGGYYVVVPWGTTCLVGGVTGLVGLIWHRSLSELIGASLGASASLTWTAALIVQATSTQSAAYTAACMAGVLALLFTQRWVDIYRQSRR